MKLQTPFDFPSLKRMDIFSPFYVALAVGILLLIGVLICCNKAKPNLQQQLPPAGVTHDILPVTVPDTLFTFTVAHDVKIKDYFKYVDSLTHAFDTLLPYKLTEYLLVRSNPFIMDTLENTDYYRMKMRDTFVYDQKQLLVLKQGDRLKIPTQAVVDTFNAKIGRTRLDINIPEFKLRVIEGADTIYTFPVRVGQNRTRFLSEVGRETDLRTRVGNGYILNVYKKDYSTDPVKGKKFTTTNRDDERQTLMPLLPWLETKINGQRFGQLIHPTTNPASLWRAYSNGCMGVREADIWRIYYYAPVGTKVNIRYNLMVREENGDTLQLKDIYNPKRMIFQ